MGFQLGKWLRYAQARLDRTVQRGLADEEAELDRLEAERAERVAERPWLADDAEAPSFEQAKARIEWETEQQRAGRPEGSAPPAGVPVEPSAPAPDAQLPADGGSGDVTLARAELDRQAREARDRLEAIRKELGVEPPEGGPAS